MHTEGQEKKYDTQITKTACIGFIIEAMCLRNPVVPWNTVE